MLSKASLREERAVSTALMEIPGPPQLALLRFKGKQPFPVMGSRDQRGREASRKVRAPN